MDKSQIAKMKQKHRQLLVSMSAPRESYFKHWRELGEYFLPRRYRTLLGRRESSGAEYRNKKLLDSTSVNALNILSSGMMNGITSPARRWFRFNLRGKNGEAMSDAAKKWLSECEEITMSVLSESNFYNSVAILYHEWACFGTAAMMIREDFDDVIRCYNIPMGEYYISVDNAGRVDRLGREFEMTLDQMVKEFGLEKLSEQMQEAHKQGGAALFKTYTVNYLLEENFNDGLLAVRSRFREVYWMQGNDDMDYLAVRPMREWGAITPRWEVTGNDPYGVSPTMDALGDVIQLQHMLLRQGQGLDKMISPALIVDQQLRNRPKALAAGGITYASNMNANFGAKAAYEIRVPFQEMDITTNGLRERIREALHNNLFNMISQLDTVRSATEIDARREEKLVHLGPVLERFYNEGLSKIITRVFGVIQRMKLFPEPPEELRNQPIDVKFVSILSDAQRASDVTTIERFFSFAGQLTGVYPEAASLPKAEVLLREYAEGLGISPEGLRTAEEVAAASEQNAQQSQLAQTAEVGSQFAKGAQALGGVDVGGGQNAVQALMGLA